MASELTDAIPAFQRSLEEPARRQLLRSGLLFTPIIVGWVAFDAFLQPQWLPLFSGSRILFGIFSAVVLLASWRRWTEHQLCLQTLWITGITLLIAPMVAVVDDAAFFPYLMGYSLAALGGSVFSTITPRHGVLQLTVHLLGFGGVLLVRGLSIDLVAALFFLTTLYLAVFLQVVHRYETERDGYIARRRLDEERRHTEALRRQAEADGEALSEALTRLQHHDRQKTHFFQTISHELRTPLTLILHPLQALAARDPSDEIAMARRNAHRLLRLVNQLLDFQRMTVGQASLAPRPLALLSYLETVVEMSRPAAEARGLALVLEPPDVADLVVVAEPDALEKALFNYLANALKFTPAGGTITLRLEDQGRRHRVCVDDTGPGVAPEDRPKLFQLFSQLDGGSDRRMEGTGLGLALTRELVEAMGGAVGVSTGPDGGARFWLELEETDEPAEDEARPRTADWALPATPRTTLDPATEGASGKTILIVDDLDDMRMVVAELLRRHGHRALTAASAEDALDKALLDPPDLLVTDWMMPGTTGLELIERWRSNPALHDIPTVLLTARDDQASRLEGHVRGADAFLGKPFEERELLAVVDNLLSLKEREHDLEETNARLDQALMDAEAASAAKSTFLASMSHELRTPLNAILGYAELIREDLEPNDPTAEDIRKIEQAGSHLLSLINDVLDLSKVAAGELGVRPEAFDIVELVEEIVPLAETSATRNGNALQVDPVRQRVQVFADRVRVRQVVLNLLSNAAKFTSDGVIEIAFRTEDTDAIGIEVSDTGIGMDPDQLARAFQPFVQVHREGHIRYGGTGLGLAVSRQLAVLMDGDLTGTSTSGVGTRFTLILPRPAAAGAA